MLRLLEYHEHDVDNLALEVVGQTWSSEVISLFFADLEGRAGGIKLPFVNGSLMPRMRDACEGSSESLGSPRSLCSECLEERRRCSDAKVPSLNERPGL